MFGPDLEMFLPPPTFVPLTLLLVALNLCATLSRVQRMSACPLDRSAFWGALKDGETSFVTGFIRERTAKW
jgi:hypothetical protein